ncbi:MAG: sulfurtransferase FdhD [Betaproteobacteria bacterium HGW-Betaproteobacteria-3]|jgi:FdhD protein|nr:MAG: sulfurtransferase FdhD [Betaproteobacteria bacterium HGW-Betaproteobacteria-3]
MKQRPAPPRLTQARAPLTREIEVVNQHGERNTISIPAERVLTVYVDKRELVTLMTLGGHPELLVLGYLRNQRLVRSVDDIDSITVDWDVGEGPLGDAGAAAVKTRHGIAQIEERTARRVVTTGCGQGSVFGALMDDLDAVNLPPATLTQAQLYGILGAIRQQESTYKSAGSVHGCALFRGEEMLIFIEDVGRHNAIDTIAGWMWLQHGDDATAAAPGTAMTGADKVFYTTGRLTSEMVIKSAQMGVPIVVSRSGITQMGHEVAQHLGLCTIGRATNKHFVCYTAPERLWMQPELAGARLRAPA